VHAAYTIEDTYTRKLLTLIGGTSLAPVYIRRWHFPEISLMSNCVQAFHGYEKSRIVFNLSVVNLIIVIHTSTCVEHDAFVPRASHVHRDFPSSHACSRWLSTFCFFILYFIGFWSFSSFLKALSVPCSQHTSSSVASNKIFEFPSRVWLLYIGSTC
jgi:hypothetical protein